MLRRHFQFALLLCLPFFANADNLHGLSESHYQFIYGDFDEDGQADTFALARKKNKHHYVVFAGGKRQKIKAKIGGKDWDAESFSVIADKNLIRLRNAKGGIDEHEIEVDKDPCSSNCGHQSYNVKTGEATTIYSLTAVPATPVYYPGTLGGNYKAVYSSYTMSLPSVSGATEYQLYESAHNSTSIPADSSYQRVYTGSSTVVNRVSTSDGYRWLRYKACNSAGCSGLSPWRRLYIYGTPGTVNNLHVTAPTVNVAVHFSVSWTPAAGAVDGTTYTVYQSYNGNESAVYSVTRNHWSESRYVYSTAQYVGGAFRYRLQACSPSVGCGGSVVANQTVIAPNTAPVANTDYAVINEDTTTYINVLGNDTDIDGDSLLLDLYGAPSHGTFANINNQVRYAPNAHFNGVDSFSYRVRDGSTISAPAVVYVTVNAVNDAPSGSVVISGLTAVGQTLTASHTLADVEGLGTVNYQWYRNGAGIAGAIGTSYLLNINDIDATLTVTASYRDGGGTLERVTSSPTAAIERARDALSTGGTVADVALPTDQTLPASDFEGAMPGTATVNGGAAGYTIPIAMPPGRHGLQPSVSLNYSSRSGNGIAGMGWGLSAGGAINRCESTLAQDGVSAGIAYSETSDRLCLNGQRLMVTSGTYGQAEATYATEIDSFVTVTQLTGGMNHSDTTFEVALADGSQHTYGVKVTPTGAPAPLSWLLSRVADVSGKNHMTYVYDDKGDGEVLLTDIKYTGDGTNEGNRRVSFDYEDRKTFSTFYQAGGKTRQTQRLKTISTFINNTTKVRDYQLTYQATAPLLSAVTACGGTLCYEPTTFAWSDDAIVFKTELLTDSANTELFPPRDLLTPSGSVVKVTENLLNVIPRGDANGDGVRDMQNYFLNAEGDSSPNLLGMPACSSNSWLGGYQCLTADFNLDGKTDEWGFNGDWLQLRHSDSAWFNTAISRTYASYIGGDVHAIEDFNGDGWPDILFEHHRTGGLDYVLYLHSTNSTIPYPASGPTAFSTNFIPGSGSTPKTNIQVMGDMDGNGLPDIVLSSNTSNQVTPRLSTLQLTLVVNGVVDFSTTRSVSFTESGNLSEYSKFIDVNGDGLPDWLGLISKDRDAENATLHLRLNEGDGTFATATDLNVKVDMRQVIRAEDINEPKADEEHWLAKYGDAFKLMDVDGDGRQELIMPGERIVNGCHKMHGLDTQCGDDLYRQHRISGQLVNIPSSADFGIYQYDALHFSENAAGQYTAEIKSTDLVGAANHSVVVDSLGKGLPDLLFVYGCYNPVGGCSVGTGSGAMQGKASKKIYTNRNYGAATGNNKTDYQPANMLQKVTNGVGVISQWDYRPLSSETYPNFYQTNFTDVVDAEHFHFASSMYAVAKFEQSNGIGSLNALTYQYRGAMYNTKGRGFRGFRTIIAIDHANAKQVTTTDFLQKFPFSSLVESQTLTEHNKTVPFSITTNDWRRNPNHLSALYNAQSRQITCDLAATICDENNHLSQRDTTITGLDQYNNITGQTRTITDEKTDQTTTITTVFDTNAWPNKVTAQTVDNIDQIVTTHYQTYDTTHRKPTTVVVAAGSIAINAAECTTADCLSTTSVFNTSGLPTDIDVGGRTTTLGYSADGYFATTITQGTHVTTTLTDPATGANTSTTAANGVVTTTSYDTLARPTKISQTGQPDRHLRYHSLAVASYQAGTPKQVNRTDILGRPVRSETTGFNGELIYQDISYNARGLTASESAPYAAGGIIHNTTYTNYDVLGRAGKKVTPQTNGNLTVTYTYKGFKTDITTADLSMSRSYNGLKQLVQTTDALGGITQYSYDGGGNPIKIEDAAGNIISAHYDKLGRKTSVDDPNQGKTTFSYNAFGELNTETDANSATITYIMDDLGRVSQRNANGSIATFTWDTLKNGLLTSHSENDITKTFQYDSAARVTATTTKIDADSYTVSQAYDANYGRLKSLKYPNNLTVGLSYNAHGYLQKEYNAASNYLYRETTAQDALGNITHACMAGSSTATCDSSGFNLTVDNEYDLKAGQMLSSQATGHRNGATAIIHHLNYSSYDSYSNLLTQSNLVSGLTATDTFTYDSLHRLTSSTLNAAGTVNTINYGYDNVGNLLKKTDYSTNAADAYSYLANSNKISEIALKTGGTTSFTYDKKGNLTHRNSALETSYNPFNKPLNIKRLGTNLTFTYGADLARYKQLRIVNGETITTHYIGKLYEVEKKGSTTTTKAYISDIAIVSDNKIRFTLRDRLGSATTFTDELGNATGYRHFDPFGKSMSGDWRELNPATLINNPWDLEMPTRRGFTDHEHLDDVELIHMNGRVYDYNVGRFMSVDPVIQSPGNSQSINPYSYIMNNPLAGTDPTGYMGCAASRLKDVCDDLGSSLGGNSAADRDLSKGLNKFDNGARVKRGRQSKTTEINAQEELAEAAKKEALNSGGSGGANQSDQQSLIGDFDFGPGPIQKWVFDNVINPVPDIEQAIINIREGDLKEAGIDLLGIVTKKVKAVGKIGDEIADKFSPQVDKVSDAIQDFLGSGATLKRNKAGDPIFVNADNTKRVRFDAKNPHGDKPHGHVEVKVGKRWKDATSEHRIYLKDD